VSDLPEDEYKCPRCGLAFPDEEHADESTDWVIIGEGAAGALAV